MELVIIHYLHTYSELCVFNARNYCVIIMYTTTDTTHDTIMKRNVRYNSEMKIKFNAKLVIQIACPFIDSSSIQNFLLFI